jgi:hypothetical protein
MTPLLQAEIERRISSGAERITVAELQRRLLAIGYKLDKGSACTCMARWLTGEAVGTSYPCKTYDVKQADNGLSAFNINARRDDNFRKLQAMRSEERFYIVSGGYMVEM